MRFLLCLLLLLNGFSGAYAFTRSAPAKQDSSVVAPRHVDSMATRPQHMAFLDSVAQASEQRDKFMADSVATMYVMPDPNRPNLLEEYLFKNALYKGYNFLDIPFNPKKRTGEGHVRKSRDPWVMIMIALLLIYTALLNLTLGPDVKGVFQSFYSKRSAQFDKEERRINPWAFIGLFLLFASTFGLFL